MRVVIAMMMDETNTFSPLPTPLVSFGRGKLTEGPADGDEAIAMLAGTNNAMAAFLDLAVCISDYSKLPFKRLPRPLYPLDMDAPETW